MRKRFFECEHCCSHEDEDDVHDYEGEEICDDCYVQVIIEAINLYEPLDEFEDRWIAAAHERMEEYEIIDSLNIAKFNDLMKVKGFRIELENSTLGDFCDKHKIRFADRFSNDKYGTELRKIKSMLKDGEFHL